MNALATGVVVEARKTAGARVAWWTAALFGAGIVLIAVGTKAAIAGGDPEVLAKLGPSSARADWRGLTSLVLQVCAAGGFLAMGVVLSWLVGREFPDGTIGALFALPVSRQATALAKLTAYAGWVVMTALGVTILVLVTGMTMGLGAPDPDTVGSLARVCALLVMTGLVVVPVAWVTTIGRGLLPGIAAAVGLLVVTQVLTIAGVGSWFPIAAPALWALDPTAVSPAQFALVPVVPLIFGALTIRAWGRLELDR